VDLRPPDFESSEVEAGGPAANMAGGAYGACLYLGERGERCSRKALASGFCARHGGAGRAAIGRFPTAGERNAEPEQPLEDRRKKALKIVVSLLGLAFLLGPVIADAFRALLAMMGDH
jgi:hypothetical protein